MKALPATLILLAAIVVGHTGNAQDFELEFSEDSLNELVDSLGDPSDGGIYQRMIVIPGIFENCVPYGYLDCPIIGPGPGGIPIPHRIPLYRCQRNGQLAISPGFEPISWQWWITDAKFDVKPGKLEFSAAVRYRVGDQWFREDRTVPAALSLNTNDQDIRFTVVGDFKIPIQLDSDGTTPRTIEVDVGRLMSFSIPFEPPSFTAAKLTGGSKTISSRADSASVYYLPGDRIRIGVNVKYE